MRQLARGVVMVFVLVVSVGVSGAPREKDRERVREENPIVKVVKRVVRSFGDGLVTPTPAPKPRAGVARSLAWLRMRGCVAFPSENRGRVSHKPLCDRCPGVCRINLYAAPSRALGCISSTASGFLAFPSWH